MHKGRGKTLQSDSYGAKEWGIDRGTDKEKERKSWGKVKGRREGKKESNEKRQMTVSKDKKGTFYVS